MTMRRAISRKILILGDWALGHHFVTIRDFPENF